MDSVRSTGRQVVRDVGGFSRSVPLLGTALFGTHLAVTSFSRLMKGRRVVSPDNGKLEKKPLSPGRKIYLLLMGFAGVCIGIVSVVELFVPGAIGRSFGKKQTWQSEKKTQVKRVSNHTKRMPSAPCSPNAVVRFTNSNGTECVTMDDSCNFHVMGDLTVNGSLPLQLYRPRCGPDITALVGPDYMGPLPTPVVNATTLWQVYSSHNSTINPYASQASFNSDFDVKSREGCDPLFCYVGQNLIGWKVWTNNNCAFGVPGADVRVIVRAENEPFGVLGGQTYGVVRAWR